MILEDGGDNPVFWLVLSEGIKRLDIKLQFASV